MEKKEYSTILMLGDPNLFFKNMVATKQDFKVVKTGYTTNFKTDEQNYFFGTKEKVNFGLFNALKSEIKRNNIDLEDVPKEPIFFKRPTELREYKKVYCVDINSAYLTALKNLHFVNEDSKVFKMLEGAKKGDRLKIVGMLATNKIVREFKNGELIKTELKADAYMRNVFFALCNEIDVQMHNLIKLKSYIFYWFDGIYFDNLKDCEKAVQVLKSNGYQSKIEELTEFKIKRIKHFLNITYLKNEKRKEFNLPIFTKKLTI